MDASHDQLLDLTILYLLISFMAACALIIHFVLVLFVRFFVCNMILNFNGTLSNMKWYDKANILQSLVLYIGLSKSK